MSRCDLGIGRHADVCSTSARTSAAPRTATAQMDPTRRMIHDFRNTVQNWCMPWSVRIGLLSQVWQKALMVTCLTRCTGRRRLHRCGLACATATERWNLSYQSAFERNES